MSISIKHDFGLLDYTTGKQLIHSKMFKVNVKQNNAYVKNPTYIIQSCDVPKHNTMDSNPLK